MLKTHEKTFTEKIYSSGTQVFVNKLKIGGRLSKR